jgi:hypothetical protein
LPELRLGHERPRTFQGEARLTNEQKAERPILHLPPVNLAFIVGTNFKYVGELTEADVEWWQSFGRHLEAARQTLDPIPYRWKP